MKKISFFLLLGLLLSAVAGFGQGIVTGSIAGTVQDQQQAVVTGAKVTAVQSGTNSSFTGVTSPAGQFVLRGLPPGTYTVTIEAPNFNPLTVNGVVVNTNNQTGLGVQTLGLGTSTTEVTVEASSNLVQTESLQLGRAFETKQVQNLPIGNGLDIVALLTPGVAPAGDAAFTNTNGASPSTNGLRGRSNNFQLDGTTNNDSSIGGPVVFFGNQDAVEEVQVLTNYSAEYGHTSGAIVNYVTKAGTNTFHGTAYEFYNGNWADSLANEDKSPLLGFCPSGVAEGTPTDFAPGGCTKPVVPRLVDNRWGGTFGGPILKDRLWFFAGGNWQRIRQGSAPASSAPFVTPTPTGISQLQAAFPNSAGVQLLSNIGPAAVNVGTVTFGNQQNVLVNGVPIEFGTVTRSVGGTSDDNEFNGRVDWQIGSSDRFSGRYLYQKAPTTNVFFGGAVAAAAGDFEDVPAIAHQTSYDWSHVFSPSVLNQVRFAYSHTDVGFEQGGFPDCTRSTFASCPTQVLFSGTTDLNLGINPAFPQGRKVINYQLQDNASWQYGRHVLKFGGEYGRQRQPNTFLPFANARFTFTSFDNFINDTPAFVTGAFGDPHIDFTENQGAFYFQDDWRVKDNLTVTLGLRYELESQAVNVLHDLTVARETDPSTAIWDTTIPLELRTVPSVPMDNNNLSPVVGFAWNPRILPWLFGTDKTVVRGGFRISYDPEFYNIFSNVATASPANNLATFSCNGCLPASGLGGDALANLRPNLPPANPGLSSQTTVAPDLHNPYTEQWNLGVQRQIGSRWAAEVRYVGNHAIGLFQNQNANPALNALINAGFGDLIPGGLTPCADPTAPGFAAGYVDCNRTRVTERANTGFSIYHGVQSRLNVSNWHGVTAGASYTFSHTVDNSDEIFNTLAGGNTLSFGQNPFDQNRAERGRSGVDYPHIASVYLIYEVPWFRNQQGFLGRVLGGWQINPVWRYTSGQPYTVIQSRFVGPSAALCDPTGTFSTTFSACRPILSNSNAPIDTVGQFVDTTGSLVNFYTGDPVTAGDVHWIINDGTAAQILGTPFGGAGRNLQRGDSINNVNLALIKNVKLTERFSLQLRSELYNVMNRDYRGVPDPIVDDGNFRDAQGSFGNTFFNATGGFQTNAVNSGIGRRRLEVGAKIIF